jgi:hypothetical protein
MKTSFLLIAVLFAGFVCAQPPGIKLPSPPPPMHPFDPGESMYPWQLFKRNDADINRPHSFIINLKDSSQLTIDGKIVSDSDGYYVTWTDKTVKRSDSGRKKKIYPSQTLSIYREDNSSGTQVEGISIDSAWLFPAITGKLTAYTILAEDDLPDAFLLYIRDGDGPIVELTQDNLGDLIQGDKKALQLMQKGKIRKAIERYNESVKSAK